MDGSFLRGFSQKLPLGSFKWVEEMLFQFNKDFIKSYNKYSNIGYFLEIDVSYPSNLHNLRNYLPFCLKERQLKKLEDLHNKKEYVIQSNKFKAILKKWQTAIKFNQEAW